eukprot:TRINITY_DN531_c0_g1_i12.p1 TRINITY_DN531_c0_g1~~TRINITY_DN531_c0_g1_i12.p1  ORF type:complete len:296 (-),score=28.94 TRINITY_DN531_c0_g1_i12:441-1205(-)
MAESILLLCALLLSLACTASADTTNWLSLFSTLGTKRGISSETSANVDESSLPVPRPWLKHSFEIPKPTIHEGVEIGLLEDEVDRPRRILDAAEVPVATPAPAPAPMVIHPTITESFGLPPPPCVGQSGRSVFKSSCIGAAAPGGARQTSGAQFGEPPPPGSISPPLGEGLPQTKILPYPQRKKGMHPARACMALATGHGHAWRWQGHAWRWRGHAWRWQGDALRSWDACARRGHAQEVRVRCSTRSHMGLPFT